MKTCKISWRQYLAPPLHPEGWRILAVVAAISALLGVLYEPLGWLGAFVTVWCFYFFRDPDRVTPADDRLIVSPADGIVQSVGEMTPPPEMEPEEDDGRIRISIFMSVFDVHVNRAPMTGKVERIVYTPGTFLNATLDKASANNERNAVKIVQTPEKGEPLDLTVVQIAGLVARRILCQIREGQSLQAGRRFGMIRFGSRLDVYLPKGVKPRVVPGQRAVAGETVLGRIGESRNPPEGEIR